MILKAGFLHLKKLFIAIRTYKHAVLCAYEKNSNGCIEMLNFLKGTAEVSTYEKGFIKERLSGKFYKTFSFFEGATPENGYKPNTPFVIKISENPYSFDE